MTLPTRLDAVRGCILKPKHQSAGFEILEDGLLVVDGEGRIVSCERAPKACSIPTTDSSLVWMPGFVDTHIHFPQTRVIGTAAGPLLEWLARSTYPEEARFSKIEYAREVAQLFCDLMLAQGTTSAAIYSSSNIDATHSLFECLADRGVRGLAGLTLMDREAPAELCVSAELAMAGLESLIQRWHGYDSDRLQVCITPRFAISCTANLLKSAGQMAAKYNLPIQTHVSENIDEIAYVRQLFPEHEGYLDVYEHFGLLTNKMIFAHCIWLTDAEWTRLADRGARVSHCPDSNFFLGSGQMKCDIPTRLQIPWGLGSDVGAGRSFSLRKIASSAYDTSRLTGSDISPETLMWRATVGGAQVLGIDGQIGFLARGYDADLIAIEVDQANLKYRGDVLDREHLFNQLMFQHDAPPVRASYVRGRCIYSRTA